MGNTSSGTGHTATPPSVSPPSPKDLLNLPSSVTVLKNPLGSDIYLVGVNHVHPQASEDVRETIQKVRPDTVYVELSRERLTSVTYNGPSKMPPLVLFDITSFAQSLYARVTYYQAAILDVRPGAEFRTALDEAKKIDANVILGDRKLVTWNRIMGRITLFDVLKAVPTCIQYGREFTRLPTKDAMKQHLLDNMPTEKTANDPTKFLVPSAYPVIVSEKDRFIASVLRECPGKRVVAVVGKGHVAGIKQHLNTDTEDPYLLRAELSRTSRLSSSPLAIQSAVAGGVLIGANGAVAATMARALNRTKPTRKYRGTIPITLLLLSLELSVGYLYLTNEWLRFHTCVTEAVLTYREEQKLHNRQQQQQQQK